jgi:hypothetical protein
MPRKAAPPRDDPAESKRFIDMAREIEADETDRGRKAFERVLNKVTSNKRATVTPRPNDAEDDANG